MRWFMALMMLVFVIGCSDPVAEYNKQKELLNNLTVELNALQTEYERYAEPHLQKFVKSKLGYDEDDINKERTALILSRDLDASQIESKREELNEKSLNIKRFISERVLASGTEEQVEFQKISSKWDQYGRLTKLRQSVKSTSEKIRQLESQL